MNVVFDYRFEYYHLVHDDDYQFKFDNNDDYDFNQKNQQFISDFRACGPYLRYAPDFFFRNNEQQSNSLMQKNANESPNIIIHHQ